MSRIDYTDEEEKMIQALRVHAKSNHLYLCSECPLQNSEEEDEDGNYEGECTILIANAAVSIIEKLEKQIIDARPKWIPKDKPPKSDVSVDVWLVLNTAEEHNLVVLGCYWNGKYRNIRGHDISGWVTHWMEYFVPEPPKEGEYS